MTTIIRQHINYHLLHSLELAQYMECTRPYNNHHLVDYMIPLEYYKENDAIVTSPAAADSESHYDTTIVVNVVEIRVLVKTS